jgi:hypothetical protein
MASNGRRSERDWRPIPDPTNLTTEQLRRELSGLRDIIEARLDANDVATKLLSETVNRTPTIVQTEITHVRELILEKQANSDGQAKERFASIALQFKERDERSAQLAKTQDEALKAALQSAEKLNAAQGEANKEANGKTEISVAQQLKAVTDKIEVINGRLDRDEGQNKGTSEQRVDSRDVRQDFRQVASLGISVILGLLTVITFALYVTKK